MKRKEDQKKSQSKDAQVIIKHAQLQEKIIKSSEIPL